MAFKRSAVRSRLSPPRQKALKTRCFQGFSFFASGTKQRAFLGCARISYTPCDIDFGLISTYFYKTQSQFVYAIQPPASALKQAVPPKVYIVSRIILQGSPFIKVSKVPLQCLALVGVIPL